MIALLNTYLLFCLRMTGFVRRLQLVSWDALSQGGLRRVGYALEWRDTLILPHFQVVSLTSSERRDEIFFVRPDCVYSALRDARGFFLLYSAGITTGAAMFWSAVLIKLATGGFSSFAPVDLAYFFPVSMAFTLAMFAGSWLLSSWSRLRLKFFLWRVRKALGG